MRKFLTVLLGLFLIMQVSAQDLSNADVQRLFMKNELFQNTSNLDNAYTINNAYHDGSLNVDYVYVQQTYKGIRVYNVIQSLAFTDERLASKSGEFIPAIHLKAINAIPAISAMDAIYFASDYLKLAKPSGLKELNNTFSTNNKIVFSNGGIAKSNIKTELVWVSNDDGATVALAWNVQIKVANSSDYWHLRINAHTGAMINKGNYTVHERANTTTLFNKYNTQHKAGIKAYSYRGFPYYFMLPPTNNIAGTVSGANYLVVPFPNESPSVAGFSTVVNPWENSGINNKATTNGWHYDGTATYNYTKGNNVWAYDDSLENDAPGRFAYSTSAIPSLNFLTKFTANEEPWLTTNRIAATTNLFYWNNIIHDVTYQYGFDEPAGNFQMNNLGRGGKGGDYVRAEAQDGDFDLVNNIDNANFYCTADGDDSTWMQMYLWSPITGGGASSTKFTINSPVALSGTYTAVEGGVSTNNLLSSVGPLTGNLVLYNDDATGTTHRACNAPFNTLTGKIAVIYRGGCTGGSKYAVKIKNAQTAGAIGVIMVDSIPNQAPLKMTGTDNTITIPALMIGYSDGIAITTQLQNKVTVNATLESSIPLNVYMDGDLDNAIICHEYTHGISLRLTGGPATVSCLDNIEQGGEGWSDFIALMMTTNWSKAKLTDGTISREMGTYVAGSGIRYHPYTTDMTVNPYTYTDVANKTQAGESHYLGEIWCTVLWDMTWAIIQQEQYINPNLYDAASGKGGNNIAHQLVMTGMKLQPCSPGFLDARDAILKADSILFGSAHQCTIWSAFARRGMGYSAKQGSSNSYKDQTAAFNTPCVVASGKIRTPTGVPVPNVIVYKNGSIVSKTKTDSTGAYSFNVLPREIDTILPYRNSDVKKANGVSTIDISLIQSHILKKTLLNSPYKIIAGDVNSSSSVTTLDITLIKRLILGLDTTFFGSKLWTFVDSAYKFTDATNPFPFKSYKTISKISTPQNNLSFIANKYGDVNYDWDPKVAGKTNTSKQAIELYYDTVYDGANNAIKLQIKANHFQSILGMQFTVAFNKELLEWNGIEDNLISMDYGTNNSKNGYLTFLWNDASNTAKTLADGTPLFTLVFKKKTPLYQAADIQISNAITPIEAYNEAFQFVPIEKTTGAILPKRIITPTENVLVDIYPNPVKNTLNVNFPPISKGNWTITIHNVLGKEVLKANYSNNVTLVSMPLTIPNGNYMVTIINPELGLKQTKQIVKASE